MKMLVVLALLVLPSFAILLQPGYFPIHDDLQVMRQFQMTKCFMDGQIPCRWVPDMGYGFGYPLFNFYPPLPYYLGQLIHTLGFSFIDTAKILGILGFVVSGLGMYVLAKEFWGTKGALVSTLLYVYAPYHSVDFYVRAAINEFFALAWFPLIFWTTYRLIKSQSARWIPFVALSVALLLLSHNPMMMIFAPGYLLWIFYWWYHFRSIISVPHLLISAAWALGLAAFFTFPVVLESKYAHLETLVIGYFNYLAHFADLNQIFLHIKWGYGASELGPVDGMSFALGYLQWLMPLIVVLFIFKLKKYKSLTLLLVTLLLASLFLMHSKSTEIWKLVAPLQFLQFPWRFMSLGIFYSALVSGAIVRIFKSKITILLLLFSILYLNVQYFTPRTWYPSVTDDQKLTGDQWRLARTASIFDYLPIWAPLPPAVPPVGDVVLKPSGSAQTVKKTSNYQSYQLTLLSPTVVQLQTLYFPGWKLYVDDHEVTIDPTQDKLLGRIQTLVPAGEHRLVARFTNTPIRTIGNVLSLISWGLFVLIATIYVAKDRNLWSSRSRQNHFS